jgi:hypothetical protein
MEFFFYFLSCDVFLLHGIVDPHPPIIDKLTEILIRGYDDELILRVIRADDPTRERTDDIICFVSLFLENRNLEKPKEGKDIIELRTKCIRHAISSRLILVIYLRTDGFPTGIRCDEEGIDFTILPEREEEFCYSIDRIYRSPLSRRHGGDGIEHAIDEVEGIDDEELFHRY